MKCFVLLFALLPLQALSQTVKSNGNGNANVGSNNGTVIVNNTIRAPKEVEKNLRILTTENRGDSNGWQGILFPGKAATDAGRCKDWFEQTMHLHSKPSIKGKPPISQYLIRLGGNYALCDALPCPILAVNGQTVLTLITFKGLMGIKAEFVAEDGNLLAAIDGNIVHVNQHEAWYFERPNTHTISVVDQKHREALWVSLENSQYVSIRAKLFGPKDSSLDFNEDATVDDHGNSMSGGCSATHIEPGTKLMKARFERSLGPINGRSPVMGMR